MLFERIWVENYCLVARCKLWSAMLEWQIKNGELLHIMEPHTDSLIVFGPHESVWCDRSICIWISSTTPRKLNFTRQALGLYTGTESML